MKKYFVILVLLSLNLIASFSRAEKVSKDSIPSNLNSYFKLGVKQAEDGRFLEAISSFNKFIALKKKSGSKDLIASAFNEIGNAYGDLGDNLQAFNAYQKALSISGRQNYSLKARINKNIGAVFLSWKKLDQALDYYNIAQSFAVKSGDSITVADCLNNKGTVYEQQFNYNKAFEAYQQALKIYHQTNLAPRLALTYNNLAVLSKVTKSYDKAANFYKNSISYAKESNNLWLTAAISTNLGNLLSEQGKLTEAEIHLNRALTISKQIDAKELIYETLENLASNASRKKDFEKAYTYHTRFTEAQNKFMSVENTRELTRLQAELTAKYESEKKEKALAKTRSQYFKSKLEISRKNTLLGYAVLALVLIASSTILISLNFRVKQQKIALKNELDLKLASAEARNQLQEEKLRISRELHDNIGSQLTFINSSIQHLGMDSHALTETQKITQNTIAELRRTVWLINKQEVELDEFVVKLRDYIRPYQTNNPAMEILVINQGNCTLNSLAATNLFRIIQESVNNALKYSKATKLDIEVNCENSRVNLLVKDNGVGFTPSSDGEGYGLKNIKARTEALNGSCQFNSELGGGTTVSVNIPV